MQPSRDRTRTRGAGEGGATSRWGSPLYAVWDLRSTPYVHAAPYHPPRRQCPQTQADEVRKARTTIPSVSPLTPVIFPLLRNRFSNDSGPCAVPHNPGRRARVRRSIWREGHHPTSRGTPLYALSRPIVVHVSVGSSQRLPSAEECVLTSTDLPIIRNHVQGPRFLSEQRRIERGEA